eukprot:TRINITY_DN70096_c0_g1_i1.p1 TRINITY_DN70096_c0_g1~~TRINITY_DN70096_c0_g1_i1.p1  ORF type:complete len:1193 (+),score=133.75 TRINITY_DN70096_c0_g1_i1:243-3581(+)
MPSSMFFVLINLSHEQPLADVHRSIFNRLLVIAVCIVGVPLFTTPLGACSSALRAQASGEVAAARRVGARSIADVCQAFRAARISAAVAEGQVYEDEMMFRLDSSGSDRSPERGARSLPRITSPRGSRQTDDRGGRRMVLRQIRKRLTGLLAYGTAFLYAYHTDSPTRVVLIPVNIGEGQVCAVDLVASLFFAVDWVLNIWSAPTLKSAVVSVRGAIDILAFLPGIVHLGIVYICWYDTPHCWGTLNDWLAASCVLRLLKLERYVHAFRDMRSILRKQWAVLRVTACGAVIVWFAFSVFFYWCERESPDIEIRDNYGTMAKSLWASSINLFGEWPWCDYSPVGKSVAVFMIFISSTLTILPLVIFSEGYLSLMQQRSPGQGSRSRLVRERHASWDEAHQALARRALPAEGDYKAILQIAYATISPQKDDVEHTWQSRWLRRILLVCILLQAAGTVCLTYPFSDSWREIVDRSIYTVDIVCLIVFSIAMALKIVLMCFMRWNMAHTPEFIVGFCEVLSLVALCFSLAPEFRPEPLVHSQDLDMLTSACSTLVPLRLLRLLSLEAYVPAVSMLVSVISSNGRAFLKCAYAISVVWLSFATVLYLLLHNDDDDMGKRYRTIPRAASYSLVHLTGDYPITEYKLSAQLVHIPAKVMGICCFASVSGIFVAGFTQHMEKQKESQRRRAAERKLVTIIRSVLCIRTLQRQYRSRRQRRRARGSVVENGISWDRMVRLRVRSIVRGENAVGRFLLPLCQIMIVVGVFSAFLSSIPEARALRWCHVLLDVTEAAVGVSFTIELLLRLLAASNPLGTLRKPVRILDQICLVPTLLWVTGCLQDEPHHWQYLRLLSDGATSSAMHSIAEVFVARRLDMAPPHGQPPLVWLASWAAQVGLVLRPVRLMQLPRINRASKRSWRALLDVGGALVEPAALAFELWMIIAGLFYFTENTYGSGEAREAMATMPDALYWTQIFLMGEWAVVDFSYGAGTRLVNFCCLIGVAVTALPVGLGVEAMRGALEEAAERRRLHQVLLRRAAEHSKNLMQKTQSMQTMATTATTGSGSRVGDRRATQSMQPQASGSRGADRRGTRVDTTSSVGTPMTGAASTGRQVRFNTGGRS